MRRSLKLSAFASVLSYLAGAAALLYRRA